MDNPANTIPSALPENGWKLRLACGLAGVVCAAAILAVLALSRTPQAEEPPADVFVAREIALPVDAPPPDPTTPVESAPVAGPLRLELAASDSSPVRIQIPDLPVLWSNPAPPPARPVVLARFDIAKSAVRPPLETAEPDARRVFERNDVDQQPMALERVQPRIGYSEASAVDTPSTTMLLVVDTDGSVGEVRILRTSHDDEFDAKMVEAIREWRFSPAVRKGRKVRCWVQQSISVHLSARSRLSLN